MGAGEVSLIQAGLLYGGWTSQYDVRGLANPDKSENVRSSQLLIGNCGDDDATSGEVRIRRLIRPHMI